MSARLFLVTIFFALLFVDKVTQAIQRILYKSKFLILFDDYLL